MFHFLSPVFGSWPRNPRWASDPSSICDKITDITRYLERNGRKTLTTVQGLPKKFDQKKILKVIKKKFGKLTS
jgi:translation initiation factor 1 (eIF-1/SUI1)